MAKMMNTELSAYDWNNGFPENDIQEDQFRDKINAKKYDEPLYVGAPKIILIIASVPRTGSTLLLYGLQSLSLAAKGFEYFNHQIIPDFKLRWGSNISNDDYVNKLFVHRTTPQGIFTVKCHYDHFRMFSDILMKNNCQFIRISRRNTIYQAISLYIAHLTDAWQSSSRKKRAVQYDDYNFHNIFNKYTYLDKLNNLWDTFFAEKSISPITTVWYEELSSHYSEVIASVAMKITGTPFSRLQIPPPTLKKQAGGISEYFYQRFVDDAEAYGILQTNLESA